MRGLNVSLCLQIALHCVVLMRSLGQRDLTVYRKIRNVYRKKITAIREWIITIKSVAKCVASVRPCRRQWRHSPLCLFLTGQSKSSQRSKISVKSAQGNSTGTCEPGRCFPAGLRPDFDLFLDQMCVNTCVFDLKNSHVSRRKVRETRRQRKNVPLVRVNNQSEVSQPAHN